MSDRKAELERKKKKLEELRKEKERRQKEKEQAEVNFFVLFLLNNWKIIYDKNLQLSFKDS